MGEGVPWMPRAQWGALPPNKPPRPLEKPASHVYYAYTETSPCYGPACQDAVLHLQMRDLHFGLHDIQYNFLIGSSGQIFECRGPDLQGDRFGDRAGIPRRCIDIGFFGNMSDNTRDIPLRMLDAARLLLRHLIDTKVVHHRFWPITFTKKKRREYFLPVAKAAKSRIKKLKALEEKENRRRGSRKRTNNVHQQ